MDLAAEGFTSNHHGGACNLIAGELCTPAAVQAFVRVLEPHGKLLWRPLGKDFAALTGRLRDGPVDTFAALDCICEPKYTAKLEFLCISGNLDPIVHSRSYTSGAKYGTG